MRINYAYMKKTFGPTKRLRKQEWNYSRYPLTSSPKAMVAQTVYASLCGERIYSHGLRGKYS